MTRNELLRVVITELIHGDRILALGFIDWLVYDHEIPLSRIVQIAEKRLGIPKEVTLNTLNELV